ncbi:MAG: PTS sugar transporter subunit IIB [Chloroflexi bacterium]|nr:PTS sugar transporter subunit IIB [Chloroflexota bacterium]MBU1746524.1 PTS sugar transporter subunit IIB [Chloroflexota bacterium]MBU1878963.1 PTS sugar transporter subunit IIB [Chloroflexota bacterium]
MRAIDELGLVRIDDRLIHGQVVAVWCKHRRFTRIVIVDDNVAADPFMQEVLRLSAPSGIQVGAVSIAEGIRILSADTPDRKTTMVLMKTPQTAQALYDGGLRYAALNIGGIGSAPGRKNIFKNIAVSEPEIAILKYLLGQGVDITLLTVPGEKSRSFADLARKL